MTLKSKPSINNLRYYFSFIMVGVYLSLGLLFLFTDIGIDSFPNYRKPLGITMIIYGAIRIFLTIKKNRDNQQQDEY